MRVIPLEQWQPAERAHHERVDALTTRHQERRRRGERHPVEDFLFDYYPNSVGHLRRWHAGHDLALGGAAGMPRASWRFHRRCDLAPDAVEVDVGAFLARRGGALRAAYRLVGATLSRPAQLGCFGLHEWAMVYRLGQQQVRHAARPLRLGPEGTDAVLEAGALRCTHIDAFRFFTDDARPRNAFRPTRETQAELEQPGCLHAGMDLYKWCYTLEPVVPSRLTLAAFELAREIRILDMQASPYDLSALGYEPVAVETAAGRAAYVDAQRAFTERANAVRRSLLDVLQPLAEAAGRTSASAR